MILYLYGKHEKQAESPRVHRAAFCLEEAAADWAVKTEAETTDIIEYSYESRDC